VVEIEAESYRLNRLNEAKEINATRTARRSKNTARFTGTPLVLHRLRSLLTGEECEVRRLEQQQIVGSREVHET
jgi:hypothetical protein